MALVLSLLEEANQRPLVAASSISPPEGAKPMPLAMSVVPGGITNPVGLTKAGNRARRFVLKIRSPGRRSHLERVIQLLEATLV